MSLTLEFGQVVGIPCQIHPGAFSNEYLVTINTEEGVLSGFAQVDDILQDPSDQSKGLIRGTVVEVVEADSVKVRINGSFFTIAAGTTMFSLAWATENLQPA